MSTVVPIAVSRNSTREKALESRASENSPHGEAEEASLDESKGIVGFWHGISRGVLVSLAVHATIVLVLALIVFGDPRTGGFDLTAGFREELLVDVPSELDTRLVNPAGSTEAVEIGAWVPTESVNDIPDFLASGQIASSKSGRGVGSGDKGDGDDIGLPELPGAPVRAIRKGSFSAWTIPEDPEPRENYLIVIQVKLPGNAKNYKISDLSGMVRGTDQYVQRIPPVNAKLELGKDGIAQLTIPVPGGAKRVRDVIQIESKLLREKQKLQLEF